MNNENIPNGSFFFTIEKSLSSLPPTEEKVIIGNYNTNVSQKSFLSTVNRQTVILAAVLFAIVMLLVIVISATSCDKTVSDDKVSNSDSPSNPTQLLVPISDSDSDNEKPDYDDDDGGMLQPVDKQDEDD